MAQPVKVSDKLAGLARHEADVADRSLAAQIEHWAVLGRAAEKLLGHREVLALKRYGGGAVASVGSPRASVEHRLVELARGEGRSAALARIKATGGPRYGTDAKGRLVRVDPDGKETPGALVDGVFVPRPARKVRRREPT